MAQKGKRKVNPPHGLHKSTTAQQSSSSSEPKGINPADRVREYNNEPFKVSNGKNFCDGCCKELKLKSTIITNHIHSKTMRKGKKKLQEKATQEADIAETLSKHNLEKYLRGETLPTGN